MKVNANGQINPDNLESIQAISIDLDLNPNSLLFDGEHENQNETVFDAKRLSDVFQFMANFVTYLGEKKARDAQHKKCGTTERIGRIILSKNSPANTNIYYVASYNGDLKPPRGR